MYFGVLKRLGWVEVTENTEPSAIQDNYPSAPERVYYRLTKAGIQTGEDLVKSLVYFIPRNWSQPYEEA